jgi:hypothetical protein
MALIKCPECGKEISDKSIERTNKQLIMHTIYGMVLFVIGLIILIREIIEGHYGVFFVFGIVLIAAGFISGIVVRVWTWWANRKSKPYLTS